MNKEVNNLRLQNLDDSARECFIEILTIFRLLVYIAVDAPEYWERIKNEILVRENKEKRRSERGSNLTLPPYSPVFVRYIEKRRRIDGGYECLRKEVERAEFFPVYMSQNRIKSISRDKGGIRIGLKIMSLNCTIYEPAEFVADVVKRAQPSKSFTRADKNEWLGHTFTSGDEGDVYGIVERRKRRDGGRDYFLIINNSSHPTKQISHTIKEIARDANRTSECVRAAIAFGIPEEEVRLWIDKDSLMKELSTRLNKPRNVIEDAFEHVAYKKRDGLATICAIRDVEGALRRKYTEEEVSRWLKALHDAFNCGEHPLLREDATTQKTIVPTHSRISQQSIFPDANIPYTL